MAVPMSPDQVTLKANAIGQFLSTTDYETRSIDQNRDFARHYDDLGMAEYEAIEPFERLAPTIG